MKIAPKTIKGLLRPNGEVQLSLITPTVGCTNRPEMGPANQMRETSDFGTPNSKKMGLLYAI